jgi:carboxyl-terminal processing protease
MANVFKHLILFGLALPVSITGYHLAAVGPGGTVNAATRSITERLGDMALGSDYQLKELNVLQRDLWWVETRYVQKERADTEAMFQAALDLVERQVPEVIFQREPGGKRLHISVGNYSTILLLEPIDNFGALHVQLSRVAAILEDHLTADYDRHEVEYAFINGALSTLDPHSMLLPPEASREMDLENQGEFGGLGIELTNKDGKLIVKGLLNKGQGAPAEKAGIKVEDQIVRIEDESTINMDLNDAVDKLRGPVGTPVTIKIVRKGLSSPKALTIVRDKIPINPVSGTLLEGSIGYVQIKNFHQTVAQDLAAQLADFQRDNQSHPLKGLVLDLRSNPGGYLTQAVEVSDTFLADGVIVSTVEGAGDSRTESRASSQDHETDYPIAVLVNATSASASEIVAGALKNQDRAIIIGERTFGKGSVQHLYNNNDDSRLKLTVAKYLTPGDASIQSVGIPPDILLKPSLIEPPDKEAGETNPTISLYYREWIDREVDLDHHLDRVESFDNEPAYSVRYVRTALDSDTESEPDPNRDWEVQFARQVLLQAESARRADVLQAAAPVVARVQRSEAALMREAFQKVGVDWTPMSLPGQVKLDVRLDLGPDDRIVAGEEEDVTLTVTNLGTAPVAQLSAVMECDNPWLDHREFYLGLIGAGETRVYKQRVLLQYGYGDSVSPVTLTFRTPDVPEVYSVEHLVRSVGRALPRFSYTYRVLDNGSDGSHGNGNGMPETGEIIALNVTVTNEGPGTSQEGFVRLKDRSGPAIDLLKGSIALGTPLKDGKPCVEDSPGCLRELAPGASQSGSVLFALQGPPEEGTWDLELLVGDTQAFDYASVQTGGFYDYFQLDEKLKLRPGIAVGLVSRAPPVIQVTRGPDLDMTEPHAILSGVVNDDAGIRDVIVFHGEDKVFFQGGEQGVTALPFTAERNLEDGSNLFVILARDVNGLTATHAIRSWYQAPKAERLPIAEATSNAG